MKKSLSLPCGCDTSLKYGFIDSHRKEYPVARMARTLGVSESGFYKWSRNKDCISLKKQEDAELTEQIQDIFFGARCSFGSRKITRLVNRGRATPVNHKRIERIMRENGWRSRTKKEYVCTTDSDHDLPVAGNLLKRNFTADGPGQKMVSDTTEIATAECKLYVAAIMDLYGRMPVGMAVSRHNDRFLVMDALQDMINRGCSRKGCIMHSDRGSTYASNEYRKMLKDNGFICSMSRKGDCWDNAPMECFWGKMKAEWLKDRYRTAAEARTDIYEYVYAFYPGERIHESLGYRTPREFIKKDTQK
ncbi:MAG: IS3 family transposase [Parasporobacterium sp.]|nr:IS3 family transposase [Parasporobacterium sp.]